MIESKFVNLLLVITSILVICDVSDCFQPTSSKLSYFSSSSSSSSSRRSPSPSYYYCQRCSSSRSRQLLFLSSSISSDDNGGNDDVGGGTVSSWTSPSGQVITLIGTAHLSEKSNDEVERVIGELQPNIVMVELDKTRLSRIGIDSVKDINLQVVTSEDIELPNNNNESPWYWMFLNGFAQVARKMLTGMYNDMSSKMNNKDGGGGEFLVAIRAAESCEVCTKLILGDRDSVTTIQRAAQLAMESGNPFRVLQKLSEANGQEMEQLESRLRQELGDDVDSAEFQVAMMEELKTDADLRNRLFAKLEKEVPEFTQAFLHERDYIMSRVIAREIENNSSVQRVVAVVGLAHVPGIQSNLESMIMSSSSSSSKFLSK